MTDETKYDVFISYSHKDEEWVVNTLLPALEDAGLKVCIDYRDFDAGKPSIINMEDAVDESRHTVVVLTPNLTNSEWADFETVLTQTDDPVGRRQKLIPLMLVKCTPPKRIKSLTYVDFMRSDRLDNAWAQLFKAIGSPITEKKATQLTATRADWCFKHPYAALPNFTGRVKERQFLTEWLSDDAHPLLVLRALGGFGKSALTWHWINHDLDPAEWPKVVWWSFYDDREFGNFLRETLEYLTGQPANPTSTRQDVEDLLNELEKSGILLVLDGFERALRAYSSMNAAYQEDDEDAPEQAYDRDCVSPLAEYFLTGISTQPEIESKALMTSRLCPKILLGHGGALLKGCTEKELTALDKADAVLFFNNLGIIGTRAEIETACERYGYHPLSLRLLGGLILKDFEQPRNIAVSKKLNIIGDLKQRKHHVLEQAYDALSPERQKLMSRIACFRGSIEYKALQAIAENPDTFQDDLRDFTERGLIHHTEENNQFDLHPIVRRYAYERLTTPDRTAAHTRLRDYFEAVPQPEKIETLDDLAPVIELYHHMVRAGQLDEAMDMFYHRLNKPAYYQFGAYQLQIELLRALFADGKDKPPRLKNEGAQAWTLNELANSYSMNGEPRRAIPLFLAGNEPDEKSGNKEGVAIGLGNVAKQQLVISALGEAERNLRRRISLCREIEDEFNEAIGHQDLGRTLSYRGLWGEAEQALTSGLKLFEKQKATQSEGIIWAYRAIRSLLMARDESVSAFPNLKSAITSATRSLELADKWARIQFPIERDFVRAHWLLGAAHRAKVSIRSAKSTQSYSTGEMEKAEKHLGESLRRCRGINMVDHEADILLEVAKLRYAQGESAEALRLAGEALTITERSGYVLQGADVHLFLAELALAGLKVPGEEEMSDQAAARQHAEAALQLAHCDDGPPYHYKVAYEEAERLLGKIEKM